MLLLEEETLGKKVSGRTIDSMAGREVEAEDCGYVISPDTFIIYGLQRPQGRGRGRFVRGRGAPMRGGYQFTRGAPASRVHQVYRPRAAALGNEVSASPAADVAPIVEAARVEPQRPKQSPSGRKQQYLPKGAADIKQSSAPSAAGSTSAVPAPASISASFSSQTQTSAPSVSLPPPSVQSTSSVPPHSQRGGRGGRGRYTEKRGQYQPVQAQPHATQGPKAGNQHKSAATQTAQAEDHSQHHLASSQTPHTNTTAPAPRPKRYTALRTAEEPSASTAGPLPSSSVSQHTSAPTYYTPTAYAPSAYTNGYHAHPASYTTGVLPTPASVPQPQPSPPPTSTSPSINRSSLSLNPGAPIFSPNIISTTDAAAAYADPALLASLLPNAFSLAASQYPFIPGAG